MCIKIFASKTRILARPSALHRLATAGVISWDRTRGLTGAAHGVIAWELGAGNGPEPRAVTWGLTRRIFDKGRLGPKVEPWDYSFKSSCRCHSFTWATCHKDLFNKIERSRVRFQMIPPAVTSLCAWRQPGTVT